MRNWAAASARRRGQAQMRAIRQGGTPAARACNSQPDFFIWRMDAVKTRPGHAHPATPISPKVIKMDGIAPVLRGSSARRMMNRKIHGSDRLSVVSAEKLCSTQRRRVAVTADNSRAIITDTNAAAGASKTEIRVA